MRGVSEILGGTAVAIDDCMPNSRRLRRPLAMVFVFLAALFFAASFFRGLLPRMQVVGVSTKIAFLQNRGDQYDVLFVGTSRIHHQIIPALFDHVMSDAGMPTHSFNLGIDGLRTPEDNFVLENSLAGRSRPLRWIVLECKDINLRMQDIDQGTTRSVYWHDSRRMWMLAQRWVWGGFGGQLTLQQHVRQIRDDAEVLGKHCELYLQNELSVGALSGLPSTLTQKREPPKIEKAESVLLDGYLSEGNPTVVSTEAISYVEKLKKLRTKPATPDYGDRASQMLLRRERDLAAKYGAELVLIIPPTLKESKFTPDPTLRPTLKLLDFDRPDQFPELFALRNRRDETHLNERGAEILTNLLAQQLIRLERSVENPFP